jgi:hypothetical protein
LANSNPAILLLLLLCHLAFTKSRGASSSSIINRQRGSSMLLSTSHATTPILARKGFAATRFSLFQPLAIQARSWASCTQMMEGVMKRRGGDYIWLTKNNKNTWRGLSL